MSQGLRYPVTESDLSDSDLSDSLTLTQKAHHSVLALVAEAIQDDASPLRLPGPQFLGNKQGLQS